MGFNSFFVCRICFGANVGANSEFLRINGTGAANLQVPQMYIIMEFTNSSILISFIVYFIGGYFLYSSFMQLVPLIIKPTHNNFSPLLCL
jgi:ABC-2 type transport system permease protein